MTTKLKLAAGASALLILLSGCEKKAGGQVVAVVNGEEITQQELNGELQGAKIPPTADQKAVMAQLLQRVIDRKLMVQKAKAEGLDQSPAYLEQVRRQQDALIVNLLAGKAAKAIVLPDSNAVKKFIAENPTLFSQRKKLTLDQISFAQPSDMSVLRQLQPAHTLDAIAATLTTAGIQFARGTGTLDTAMIPPALAKRIEALPPGEPFVVPDSGKLVASVITSAETTPTPEAQAGPAALGLLRQQALADSMRKQLEAAQKTAKIEYKEGFGPPKKPAAGATPPGVPAPVATPAS